MLSFLLALSALPALPSSTQSADAAAAQAATPMVKPRAMVTSADGRRIGRVDRVRGGQALVFFANRLVAIPVATLSGSDDALTTSLTLAEVARIRH